MADTQTATIPEIEMPAEPAAEPQRSRAEELLARRRALLEREEAARRAAARQEPTIEFGEFLLMLAFAGFFDLVSLIPWANFATVVLGNIVFSVWFWFKKLSFKKLRFVFPLEGIVEAIPFLSMFPGFIGLVIAAYVTHRAGRILSAVPGGHLAAAALERRTSAHG